MNEYKLNNVIKSSNIRSLNPTTRENSDYSNYCDGIDAQFTKFIYDNKPYSHFITITFAINISMEMCCRYASTLLRWVNRKLFGRSCITNGEYIEGFAFVENHKSGISKNDLHLHLLLKPSYRFNDFKQHELEDIIETCAAKIYHGNKLHVFNAKGIDVTVPWDDGVIGYCLKQIRHQNFDRIKLLGECGLSDEL